MTNHSLEACMAELDLTGRSFLTIHDFTPAEVAALLDLAIELKTAQKRREPHALLAGRAVALIFMKTSTRTRVSFEIGVEQLGAQPMFLSANDIQLRVGETIKDTANVMSRYVDCIMIRTFAQKDVDDLAEYGQIPVINGLTDTHHPCQGMADALTIREHCGRLQGVKLVYSGDGNNVAHSLAEVGAKTGMRVVICTPAGFEPDTESNMAKNRSKLCGNGLANMRRRMDGIGASHKFAHPRGFGFIEIELCDIARVEVHAATGSDPRRGSLCCRRLAAFEPRFSAWRRRCALSWRQACVVER